MKLKYIEFSIFTEIPIEIFKLIFSEWGKPAENEEKNSRSTGDKQQTTLLTYDTESGNRSNPGALICGSATPPVLQNNINI